MGPDRPPDKARQENAPHSQSLAGEGFVFVGEWELRIPPPQCSTRPNIRCLFGADRGGKGATQSGRCSADAVMWHAVQHGDLYVLCGTQCEWYVDVLPCRRCHGPGCGTTQALSCGQEGGSLKHTAVHHRLRYHVGNSSLHLSPYGNSPTLIQHCTAAIWARRQSFQEAC